MCWTSSGRTTVSSRAPPYRRNTHSGARPRYTGHPNGCNRLTEAVVITDDLPHFIEKYGRYVDAVPVRGDDSATFTFELGSRLVLLSAKRAAEYLPGTLFPPVPGIAAVAFNTPNFDAQRVRLNRAGITFADSAGRLIVPAEEASGVAVIFESK